MARYVGQRFLAMIPTLFFISIVGFLIIEVPPGDYFSMYLDQLQRQGVTGAQEQVAAMRVRYGADQPIYKRYFIWLSNFARGDFGNSLIYRKPVRDLIFSRLAMTIVVSFSSLLVIYAIGIPVGIYSATHKYSFGDNLFTFVAFMGLGLPDFLLALVFLVVALKLTGSVPTGLFSSQYEGAPWSLAKLADLLKHMWVPAAIIAISSTAGLIRTMRGNLLDTLRLNYVQAARAKGLKEGAVIRKHAVRNALHPIVMGIGMDLPYVVSGSEITAIVLGLPTTGPLYLQAMQQQDMLLGSTMLMLLSATLVVGNFLADMLLLWLDPRIRYD